MRQTNTDLWRYYDIANYKHFRNRLPKDIPIRFANLPRTVLGRTCICNHGIPQAIMTMLHEMVHVENPKWKGHGWKFEHRMLKLAKARAFAGLW